MLSQKAKNQIANTFSELNDNMAGFSRRSVQNKMVAEIANTLGKTNKENILVIEAPTGIGKTFAYLVPGIVLAQELNIKLVIASANILLQDQLFNKDLPDLQKYTALDFSVSLAKGRSRYVCLRDLTKANEDIDNYKNQNNNQVLPHITFNKKITADDIRILRKMFDDFSMRKWNGELDNFNTTIKNNIWQTVSCNKLTCSNNKCEFYQDCVFFKQRKKLHTTDVVVTNHDLILSDITVDNNILPKFSESFIIIDEAHNFPKKALSHFAFSGNLDNILNLNKQINKIHKDLTDLKVITTPHKIIKNNILMDITKYVERLNFIDDLHIFECGVVNEDLTKLIANLLLYLTDVYDNFATLNKHYNNQSNKLDDETKEKLTSDIAYIDLQLTNYLNTFKNFNIKQEEIPQARWINKRTNSEKKYYYFNSAKINVAKELRDFFAKVKTVILTSATLSTLGNFNLLNEQLGINNDIAKFIRLPSPFNLKNAKFIVANTKYSPKQSPQHTNEITNLIRQRINKANHGVLVLFASYNQMHQVAENIAIDDILMQGELTKQYILSQHKKIIDAGKRSVIFGLDSFAEGVSLENNYLTLLIIAKLRFAVPTTPLEKTMYSYLDRNDKKSFLLVALPNASLRLNQACGRLLRTQKDEGEIVIFDNRLKKTQWGKILLDSLPDYKIIFEQ